MKRAIAARVMSSILRSFTSTETGKDRYIEELGIGYARGGHLRRHLQSLGFSLDQLLQGEGRPWADSWRNRNRINCSGRLPNICPSRCTGYGRRRDGGKPSGIAGWRAPIGMPPTVDSPTI